MSNWQNFLAELFADKHKPGKVMICFVNRYLEGLDGIRYKIRHDGIERTGTTTVQDFGIELTPRSLKPIETFVWSRKAGTYKKLDDVIPEPGRKKLVRKVLKTFKAPAMAEILTDKPTKSRPTQPAAAPAPAPTPAAPQGVTSTQQKNESEQPQIKVDRTVPGEITVSQLRKIFPLNRGNPSDAHLQAVADELNTDLAKFHLESPLRRAHFFGQIKQEAGPRLSGEAESLNYAPEGLIATFGYYQRHRREAQLDGRVGTRAARQQVIANKVYGPDGAGPTLGNDRSSPDDGWDFRGRGMKQLTGRDNYQRFTDKHARIWGGTVDFVASPNLLSQMPYAIRSAVVFWVDKNCYEKADQGISDTDIDAVTRVVNAGELRSFNSDHYRDNSKNPVLKRRSNVKLAYAAFT
jgi:predicted chitinase